MSSSPWWLWWSQKTGPTDLVTQMDQQVQNDLVEKSNIATQKIGFLARRWAFPTPEGSVWVIDPIDGTNNFCTSKGRFGGHGGLFRRRNRSFGLITMLCGITFYGVEFPVFIAMRLNWRPCRSAFRELSDCQMSVCQRENDWGMADLGMDSLGNPGLWVKSWY